MSAYSLGVHGHARSCRCINCQRVYATKYGRKLEESWRLYGAAAPIDLAKPVFVKAHFRKQKGFANGRPFVRRYVRSLLRSLRK